MNRWDAQGAPEELRLGGQSNISEQITACLGLWSHKLITHKNDYRVKGFNKPPLPKSTSHKEFNKAHPAEQAEFWLFIDSSTQAGSMEWVCTLFGLDANRVRTKIQPNWRVLYETVKLMGLETPSQTTIQLVPHAKPVAKKNRVLANYKFPHLTDFQPSTSVGCTART